MMTPLLYCTLMMVWSAVTPVINSCECCCVYYIDNFSLTISQCLPPQLISGKHLFFTPSILSEFLRKAM